MTKLLEEAFARVSDLSEEEQDQYARFLLAEVEHDNRLKSLLDDPNSNLSRLADEARDMLRRDEGEDLDPSRF